MNLQNKETRLQKNILLSFLIITAIVPFFVVIAGILQPKVGYFIAERCLVAPCLLFFGAAMTRSMSPSAKKILFLSSITVLWFVATQLQHHMDDADTRSFGVFAAAYLLAFPYAEVTGDGRENVGLKWVGTIYLAFSLFMTAMTLLLLVDAVPEALASGIFWDGARATLLWHPNGSAFVLLLGLGFDLYFLFQAKSKAGKFLLGILAVLHFLAMSLTNSRTTVFLASALIGGTAFFTIWNGSRKRFIAGAAAALAVALALVCTQSAIYDLHTQMQIKKVAERSVQQADPLTGTQSPVTSDTQKLVVDAQTGEVRLLGSGYSGQRELGSDMKSLNGRTSIWRTVFLALKENPKLTLWGTEYVSAELSWRMTVPVVNAHNAWLQMVMRMGIPGLLSAIAYTVIALWNSWRLLWRKNEELSKKIAAMLVVCLLAASVLEVYLFVGEDITNCENFLFFLLTGYLIQWNQLADKVKGPAAK